MITVKEPRIEDRLREFIRTKHDGWGRLPPALGSPKTEEACVGWCRR